MLTATTRLTPAPRSYIFSYFSYIIPANFRSFHKIIQSFRSYTFRYYRVVYITPYSGQILCNTSAAEITCASCCRSPYLSARACLSKRQCGPTAENFLGKLSSCPGLPSWVTEDLNHPHITTAVLHLLHMEYGTKNIGNHHFLSSTKQPCPGTPGNYHLLFSLPKITPSYNLSKNTPFLFEILPFDFRWW